MQIQEIIKKNNGRIDIFDLELIVAYSLKKTREFVLMHPEKKITKKQETITKKLIERRMKGEPVAYIIGHKEFYGLDFMVNKNTLIPRPETEQITDSVINEQRTKNNKNKTCIIDIGTGSGNIIISIAHELEKNTKYPATSGPRQGGGKTPDTKYYAIDISKNALTIAKKNAKNHGVDKKIIFLNGDLLSPLIRNCELEIRNSTMIIVGNLPYLSDKIYKSAPVDVKKYEPKSALYSANAGLAHYEKLLKQIKNISKSHKLPASTRGDSSSMRGGETISCFLEFSPEQKQTLEKLIRNILPQAKIFFAKDLAGKWRICKITQN